LANGDPDVNSGELKRESETISGFQLKGGLSLRVNPNFTLFGNAGYVSKVPIFDAVINDQNSEFIDNPENEKFTSLEAGLTFKDKSGLSTLKLSGYYTLWNNRVITQNDFDQGGRDDGLIVVTGMDARYSGLEVEWAFQPSNLLRFDAAASIGNWEQTNDAKATFKDYSGGTSESLTLYIEGLKIGDAPQSQIAVSGTVSPVKGLSLQGIYRHYANYYAQYNAQNRIDPFDRKQSWKIPSYSLVDFHAAYDLPLDVNGIKFQVFAHVFNALDETFIQDATDNSKYNAWDKDHDADDAEVFFGLPRTFNVGISIAY